MFHVKHFEKRFKFQKKDFFKKKNVSRETFLVGHSKIQKIFLLNFFSLKK